MKSLYDAPDYYAMMFDARRDDVAFYRSLADSASRERCRPVRVIEYGAGNGRISLALAAAGHAVLAVENAPAMLRAFRERLSREPESTRRHVTLVEADALDLSLGERNDLLICPFNGLAHFETHAALTRFFDRVHEHLEVHGRFAFDVWLPNVSVLAGAQSRSPWLDDPRGDGRVRCIERFSYDPLAQVLTASLEIRDEQGGLRDELVTRLRQFFPQETLSLLAQHGFTVTHRTTRFDEPHERASNQFDSTGVPGEMIAYVCVSNNA